MVRVHQVIRRVHPRWLIYPAILCFWVASVLVARSQDSNQFALADAVPDTLYRSQTARVEPPPPTPEELGDALMLHQRYQAGIAAYSKGTPNSDLWNKMGIAYQMMNGSAGALHCYKESLKLNPRNAHALNNLGSLYFSLREFGAAERMYRKALALEPHTTIVQLNLGTDLIAENKFDEGWRHYQAALDIDPHAFENTANLRIGSQATARSRGAVSYYMAKGLVRAGEMSTAIDHLRLALNQGFATPRKIEADESFAALRGIPAFQDMLSQFGHQ
jgi:tetratricopeptide (TPR) repeat protein